MRGSTKDPAALAKTGRGTPSFLAFLKFLIHCLFYYNKVMDGEDDLIAISKRPRDAGICQQLAQPNSVAVCGGLVEHAQGGHCGV